VITILHLIADRSRLVLVIGLLAGIAMPGLAGAMAQSLPLWIAMVMFAGALRLSPAAVTRLKRGLGGVLRLTLAVQLALPLGIAGALLAIGQEGSPLGILLLLLAAAPPIIGSANIAALLGLDPGRAMQLMLVGTLILPLTVLPVLWILPGLGAPLLLAEAALRLLALVILAGGGALACRALFLPEADDRQTKALDGASVGALAVMVVALMPAVRQSALETPLVFSTWLALAFALNFGLQIVARPLFRIPDENPTAFTLGNRNLGIFFAALPTETTAPLLVFLGCYQVPMFLSPLLMGWLYRR
jgi:hypothetical protein